MSTEKFYFLLKKNDSILVNNISDEHSILLLKVVNKENKIITNQGKKFRVIRETDKDYTLFFISECKSHLKSNKLAISDANSILKRAHDIDEIISHEKNIIKDNFSKFTHNLKTLCTMSIQDIEYFSPTGSTDDFNISKLSDWKIFINELDSSDKDDLAKTLMRIYKNMQHVQNDITVYEYLFNNIPVQKKISDHSVHKVITRCVLCCASLLLEKGVRIKIGEASWPIKVDYASIQVALFYIMDNIIKYSKPNTDLTISFHQDRALKNTTVTFDMISLFVKKSEEEKIFDEGFSGSSSINSNMQGKGLGMYTSRKLLDENNAKIKFIASEKYESVFLNRKYGNNKIVITFN